MGVPLPFFPIQYILTLILLFWLISLLLFQCKQSSSCSYSAIMTWTVCALVIVELHENIRTFVLKALFLETIEDFALLI